MKVLFRETYVKHNGFKHVFVEIVDTPRSDIEDTTQEQETKQKRPSTAPSKRLLSSSTPTGGRPRSARNDSSHSVNILKDESENKENLNNTLVEKLIFLQNGLFITGNPVCRVHSPAF